MVEKAKTKVRAAKAAAPAKRPERLPWTPPRLETGTISSDTAATNVKVVQESPNSLS
jgi:hypothetical protein